jgi:autotransporter-associated beta strand protein
MDAAVSATTDIGPQAAGTETTGEEILFTLVYDSAAVDGGFNGQFRLYRDAALVSTYPGYSQNILGGIAGVNNNRLGAGISVPPATPPMDIDPIQDLPAFLTGSLNEFRIYNNVLTPIEILTNLISGPDVTSVSFNGKTWNTGTNNWNTGGNWTAAGVPAVGDRATIANGGTATVSTAVPQVGALTISNGTLSIGSGGSLNVSYPIELNTGAGNTATINVTGGGVLSIGAILPDAAAGAKTINIDGGIIRPGFRSALVTPGATAVIGAGGATFDTPGTDTMNWNSDLSGSGNVTKIGTGTLILRPSNPGAGLAEQNPNFSGEVFVEEGIIDVQREHGVFGTAGSTSAGIVHMTDSTIVIHTANPIGFRKEFPADLHLTGQNVMRNMVDRPATEIRMEGSLSGDGSLEFVKPVLAEALGVDFQHRANPTGDPQNPVLFNDNSNFTGRVIFNSNWAVRFFATRQDPDQVPNNGDEVVVNTTDFPNAIVDLANAGAFLGKRGTSPNQTIRLGGVAGVANLQNPDAPIWSRLLSSIAGEGTLAPDPLDALIMYDFNDVTYEIGGASQNAVFNGRVTDVIGATFVDQVTVRKVGGNTQTFAGPNTYSGTTTVNGGTLSINGTHSRDALMIAGGELAVPAGALPVGDYTVNTGGTLGGTGSIGSEADPVNVNVVGGTVNPGASVGTLTVEGGASFNATSHFGVEISGSTVDKLIADSLNIASGAILDVLPLGNVTAGQYTIAEFGSRTGTFTLNAPAGFSVAYNANNIMLTAPNISVGVAGDYNGNGVVDAADYTYWRDRLGQNLTLPQSDPNDTDGVVTTAEYNFWKSRFGATSGSASSSLSGNQAIPEPASLALSMLAVVAWLGVYRRPQ